MNKDRFKRDELSPQERWLADSLAPEAPSSEHLKMRVEIEANERWLASVFGGDESSPAGLRTAVLNEVSKRSLAARPRRAWNLAVAAIGLAAVLGLAFIGTQSVDIATSEVNPEIEFVIDVPADEEIDLELDHALTEVEALLASLDESSWDDFSDGL